HHLRPRPGHRSGRPPSGPGPHPGPPRPRLGVRRRDLSGAARAARAGDESSSFVMSLDSQISDAFGLLGLLFVFVLGFFAAFVPVAEELIERSLPVSASQLER